MALGRPNPISLKRGGIFIFPGLSSVRILKLYPGDIRHAVDMKLFWNLHLAELLCVKKQDAKKINPNFQFLGKKLATSVSGATSQGIF